MNAADRLVAGLEAEGVEYVYGLAGEETTDLLFAIRDSGLTFVPVRHEQGAAFMADVEGRLTGRAGVCFATLGPGATNLITGIADAQLDKSPLVAVTAQGGMETMHHESHQHLDIVETFDPVVKWNTRVHHPDITHEAVRKAFKVAETEKPGATHLELPEDVAATETAVESMPARGPAPESAPNPDAVADAAARLEAVDSPAVLAGNGAVRGRAADVLRAFVDRTEIPVASTYMAKGAIPDDSPQSLMTVDSGDGAGAAALAAADLVLAVGYDVAEHDPAGFHGADTPIVHVDSQPAEVYAEYDPAVEVVGNIARGVAAIDDATTGASFDTDWYAGYRNRVTDRLATEPEPDAPFTLEGVMPALRDALGNDDVLLSDTGRHKMVIAQEFPTFDANAVVISNGLATMGIAVPGAVAADLNTDGNVVAATGDGGFLMNAAELDTAQRLDCSFTTLVFRDDDLSLITEKQRETHGDSFGTELTNPDLVAFAESFGVDAYRPETRRDLRADLRRAVESDDLALVDVPVASL
ncbi:acetolactate synthase large subunit [Halocalculus aciditolerans]|uniref:Acetolactate synthase n=1 Tax=Halocalculus aciditolerans TaxID=1383812 RepID=A0A830FM72_9EURY|nr:acetolactate synthase large subunit [Halocalculus aciditolerans]GGL60071.1 acetolactate synthase [Halocalculus aciditolerans]